MNQIIAKKIKVIQKNGLTIDYTHVTSIKTEGKYLYVEGETLDFLKMSRLTYDRNPIEDINMMLVEFYIPK